MADDNNVPPLSTDELRSNASKWTLACDAGLLAHLEQFSQNVFEKANKTESSLNNLLDEVEEVITNFNIVSNQFQSLQNSQFLENRVYDDETPTEDFSAAILTQNEETQQQIVTKYKEAVGNGLLLLDSHFEQVEVPESSDSDDELSNGGSTLLLKPKAAYTQPLPLIIGSAEWWADDTVGLGDFIENDESEPELSNSDASPHVEKRIRLTPSTTSQSSEDEDHSLQVHDKLKSILNEPEPILQSVIRPIENDLFGGSSGLFEDDLFSKASAQTSSFVPATSGAVYPDTLNQTKFSSKSQNTTEGKIILFSEDGADADNSLFKNNAGPLPSDKSIKPESPNSQVPQEFTKELFSKLGSIAQNQNAVPKSTAHHEKAYNAQSTSSEHQPQHSLSRKSEVLSQENNSKESNAGGLFDDLVDDDDLFGKKPPSLSVRPLAVPIKLFDDDNDDDIFSNNVAPTKDTSLEKYNDASTVKDLVTKKSKSVFNDDLFSDDLDGDLFSSSSNNLQPKAPRLILTGSENDSPVYVKQPGLIASTPAVNIISSPDDHLFGSISRLEKGDSISPSQSSLKPQNSGSFPDYPSENDAIIVESVQYDSRDLGFIETSDISEIGNSENRDSPANWFNPQLSSTRSAAAYNETSGYKTANVGTGINSVITPSSTEASNILRNTRSVDQRISSVNEESDSTNNQKQVTNNSNDDSPSMVGNVRDSMPKNIETPGEPKNVSPTSAPAGTDDLFNAARASPDKSFLKTQSQVKKIKTDVKLLAKMESLFDNDEDDDLFSSKPVVSSDPAPSLSKEKKASLFDDDGDDLFSNGSKKAADSILNDSGRPHFFEESTQVVSSTSTLPSIYAGKPTSIKSVLKPSPFDDVEEDLDLFKKINSDPVITSVPKIVDPETGVVSKLPSHDNKGKDNTNQYNSNVTISKKPTPPSSLDICKVHDAKSSCDATDGESLAVNKKIGKLNIPINLKINPSTLLPGAKRVKPAGGQLDHTDDENEKLTINQIIDVPDTSSSSTEASACLPGSEHILPSTLKDRVRVSIKRRPQSRRARQDALRSSGIDFSPIEEVSTPSAAQSPGSIPSLENSSSFCSVPSQNVLSPSTDEEDFRVPHLEVDTHGAFDSMLSKKEEHNKNEPLLFDSAPVISPTEEADIKPYVPAESKLFTTENSSILDEVINDDLFSSNKPSVSVPTKNVHVQEHKDKKIKNKPSVNVSDSLFGDIEDDDIFLAKPASSFPSKVVTSVKARAADNDSPNFIDPLGLLKQIQN